jgi:hypothetical protein
MFVKIRPLNGIPIPQQVPILPLLGRGMQEPGIPLKRDADAPTIVERDNELLFPYSNVNGYWLSLKDQSSHAKPPIASLYA